MPLRQSRIVGTARGSEFFLDFLEAKQREFAHHLVEAFEGFLSGIVDEAVAVVRGREVLAALQRLQHSSRLDRGIGIAEHASRPQIARSEVHKGLDHVQGGGIGRGLGAAGLTDYALDFRETSDQGVAGLEVVARLRHSDSRHRHRHVERGTLVDHRHVGDSDLREMPGHECEENERRK